MAVWIHWESILLPGPRNRRSAVDNESITIPFLRLSSGRFIGMDMERWESLTWVGIAGCVGISALAGVALLGSNGELSPRGEQ